MIKANIVNLNGLVHNHSTVIKTIHEKMKASKLTKKGSKGALRWNDKDAYAL